MSAPYDPRDPTIYGIYSPEATDTQRFGDWQTKVLLLTFLVIIVDGLWMLVPLTAFLFIIGTALASWIMLRNPGYFPGQPGWPTLWEWAVGTFGVVLIAIATGRVLWASLLQSAGG